MSAAFKREKAFDPAKVRLPHSMKKPPIIDSEVLEAGQLCAVEANNTQHADEREVIGQFRTRKRLMLIVPAHSGTIKSNGQKVFQIFLKRLCRASDRLRKLSRAWMAHTGFLRSWRSMPDWRVGASARPWLRRISSEPSECRAEQRWLRRCWSCGVRPLPIGSASRFVRPPPMPC